MKHVGDYFMKSFGKARVLWLIAALLTVLAITPVTIISIHTYTSHAAGTPKAAQGNQPSERQKPFSKPAGPAPADWPELHADAARTGAQTINTSFRKSNAKTLIPLLAQ